MHIRGYAQTLYKKYKGGMLRLWIYINYIYIYTPDKDL